MSDEYLWDRSGEPDPDIARLEQLLAPLGHDAPLTLKAPRRRAPWIVAGLTATAAIAVAIYVALPRARPCSGEVGFGFTGRGGEVSCGGASVAAGVLPVGGSLDTGAHEAELTIAQIGRAELGPNTRVRLDATGADHHHLSLERGRLHARVDAPPRLFEVSTKHTDVIDLGCEYTIEVDDRGAGTIVVQRGKVELAAPGGAIVVAPAGTHAAILAGQRPGVPVGGENAALAAAVGSYERDAPGALDAILAAAATPDAITLIGLAAIDAIDRVRILTRLAEVSPPPDDVTVAAAAAGGEPFDRWREDIVASYFGLWAPGTAK